MKKDYSSPEFEIVLLRINANVLAVSDPEPTVSQGGEIVDPNDPIQDF